MNRSLAFITLLFFLFAFCIHRHTVLAFGAGHIPSFAYLHGKAFRHGNIEDALAGLVKHSPSFTITRLFCKGVNLFGGLDVKRVYFGNWLRDYSQVVDISVLKKLQLQVWFLYIHQ
ncbi:hypothetical protein AX14_008636 [Amanita brunnescens Koide BX004]|nr:hypothetical protein AX14_008636 [Amanita brunnescens Koide BX004]